MLAQVFDISKVKRGKYLGACRCGYMLASFNAEDEGLRCPRCTRLITKEEAEANELQKDGSEAFEAFEDIPADG